MVIHHVGLSSGAEQSRKQQKTKLRRLGALQQKGRLGLGTLQQKTRRLGRGTLQFLPLGVIAGVTAVSAGVLSEPASTAIETEAITTTVKVLEACSMTANPDSTDTAHSVEMIGGTVENSIGVTTIDVTCNDRDGYSVYAVGYGNNTEGNTNLTGAVTGQTIPTGTNMTTSVSNWAMRLTAVDNSTNYFVPTILSDANGSFAANHAVPSNNTKVVTFQNAIDVSKPSRFTTTYAAAITPYQAADTYTGQVKYTLVHPNYTNADGTTESYPVTLALNNAESIIINGTTFVASSATPSLTYGSHTISGTYPSGYEFDSWSSTGNISIASTSTASTTITVSGAGTLTLNAKQSCTTVTNLTGTMQTFSPSSSYCNGSSGTLTDSRDSKTYTVKKINGLWWMTQNLRFTGTSVDTTNSNVTSNKTLTWYSLKDNASSSSTECYGTVSNGNASGNGYSNACLQDSGDTTTGAWYNYYGATAGTISGTSNSTKASQDICPKNWHLPTAPNTTPGTEINNLVGNTTSGWQAATTGLAAFDAVAGGLYGQGSLSVTGYGYWWSSTADSATGRYALLYNRSEGKFYADNGYSRHAGYFVRCVMYPTMQDATASSLAALMSNTGDTTTLVDSRDGKKYSVAKLADGKFWMTSDLNLAGGTVLSSDKSDVPSASYYTLPASTAITSGTSVASGQFSSDSGEYVFNTGNNTTTCNSSAPCNSYYSWLVATAGGKDTSGTAVTGDGYNAAYSICPKGWRLPTATTSNASATSNNNWKTGDFYALATAYGANLESNYYDYSSAASANFYNNAGPGTTPGFLLAGLYNNSTFYGGGSSGYYWSSTSISSTSAYELYFNSSRVSSASSNDFRRLGRSVRCIFGE